MPELPEVETVRQTLRGQIIGETIIKIEVNYPNILENSDIATFQHALTGERFNEIARYGKYLIFILDKHSLIVHLRMEGKFFIKTTAEPLAKHEHVIFSFASGSDLRYHDTRKFGKMVLLETTDLTTIKKYPSLDKLGKEANDPDLTAEHLFNILKSKRVPIKVALLDQEIIAGLGNIYVDEVLFMAKIHPERLAALITLEEAAIITASSRKVLAKAIAAGGTTIRSYTSSLGVTGLFQQDLLVHTRVNEPCLNCQTKIKKIRVGGRGTYYCPSCQRRATTVVGVTGGIATGKSTIANRLEQLGYQVIDTDLISHQLLERDDIIQKVVTEIGIELENAAINRQTLGKIIFNDASKRAKLNAIIHPSVIKETAQLISNSHDQFVFIIVPLLFESKMDTMCDYVITVYCEPIINQTRLQKRDDISEEYAKIKMASQWPLSKKCQKADFIIDNSQDICYTYNQLDEVIAKLK